MATYYEEKKYKLSFRSFESDHLNDIEILVIVMIVIVIIIMIVIVIIIINSNLFTLGGANQQPFSQSFS